MLVDQEDNNNNNNILSEMSFYRLFKLKKTMVIVMCAVLSSSSTYISHYLCNTILFFNIMEEYIYTTKFTTQSSVDRRIILVAIDKKTLAKLGPYPLKRSLYASIINFLSASGAKVIGIELLFDQPTSKIEDICLAEAIKKNKNIVVLATYHFYEKEGDTWRHLRVTPITSILKSQPLLAHTNFSYSFMNNVLSIPPEISLYKGKKDIAFPLQIVKTYLKKEYSLDKRRKEIKIGKISIPLFENTIPSGILINYTLSPCQIFSFYDVFCKKHDPKIFQNKIVLIGLTAKTYAYTHPTPIITSGEEYLMPTILIYANAIHTILNQRFIRFLPKYENFLISFFLAVFLLGIYLKYPFGKGCIIFVLMTIILILLNSLLFSKWSVYFKLIPQILNLICISFISIFFKSFIYRNSKNRG